MKGTKIEAMERPLFIIWLKTSRQDLENRSGPIRIIAATTSFLLCENLTHHTAVTDLFFFYLMLIGSRSFHCALNNWKNESMKHNYICYIRLECVILGL